MNLAQPFIMEWPRLGIWLLEVRGTEAMQNLNEVFSLLHERKVERLDFNFGDWDGRAYWIGENVIRIDLVRKKE
jgi:hypothetical protein